MGCGIAAEKEWEHLNNVKAANNIKNDMDVYLKKYQRWIKKQLKNIHFDSVEIN